VIIIVTSILNCQGVLRHALIGGRKKEKEQHKAVIQDGLLKIYPFTIYYLQAAFSPS